MTKIKVGQIWADKDGDDMIVVTKIISKNEYDYVFNCGSTVSCDEPKFIRKGRKLIAEYDTWQQAVNSKEFKGEV